MSGFRLRARIDVSIPSSRFGQRGVTPALGYGAPHPSAGGTSTLPIWALPSAHYYPVRLPPAPMPRGTVEAATLMPKRVSTDYPHHLSSVLCPVPRWTRRVRLSISSPSARPSPLSRRVGVHVGSFGACSGFTHVTARWIAQPPKAAFVTRLRPSQLPGQAARQLPELSTTLRVEPSSTGDARLRHALNKTG